MKDEDQHYTLSVLTLANNVHVHMTHRSEAGRRVFAGLTTSAQKSLGRGLEERHCG